MNDRQNWNFQNSYRALSDKLYSVQPPIAVASPNAILFNESLAKDLGLDFLIGDNKQVGDIFSGNVVPEGADSIAQAYAGHQFGHFTMLGDGRAVLLGEQITPDRKRLDIQLKGSGQTPYSRRGDGRATVSAMLREYIISEAMHSLGIPTTRSLAVVETGEPVYREQPEEGAVLCRVASSHIRVGTFEYVSRGCPENVLKEFTDYVIDRHYPEVKDSDNPPLEFFKALMDKQIDLIVQWMRVGFIHGVMNTDNMSIPGETIDYGPCAFMNSYDPRTVFSSIDRNGRYAFANQPKIAHWNLSVFGGTILPLIDDNQENAISLAQEVLDSFQKKFAQKWYQMMYRKLGIINPESSDADLVDDLLQLMEDHKSDYTNTFIGLQSDIKPQESLFTSNKFTPWYDAWKKRVQFDTKRAEISELMTSQNPIVIPRNHLVEGALEDAVDGSLKTFNELLEILSDPYKQVDKPEFQSVPTGFDSSYNTFCGT